MWRIESYGPQYDGWYDDLTQDQQDAILARLAMLAEQGPNLKRPVIGKIESSRHKNMKELRASKEGSIRILFVFDPLQNVILLVGGDKTGQWEKWYRKAINEADQIYDQYIEELRDEGRR